MQLLNLIIPTDFDSADVYLLSSRNRQTDENARKHFCMFAFFLSFFFFYIYIYKSEECCYSHNDCNLPRMFGEQCMTSDEASPIVEYYYTSFYRDDELYTGTSLNFFLYLKLKPIGRNTDVKPTLN